MRRFQSTSTYLPHFHLLSFTVICVLSFLFFPPLVVAKSGTLFYHAHDFYRTIPEAGGLNDSAAWLIDLSGAPANAIITSVDVEYWIDHTWVGDLKVWLTTEHNGEWQDYVLWDLEGGSDQDIHEKETGLTTWNGLPANRRWYLCAADFAEQDEGRIKEWKIWVHFDGDGRTLIPQVGPYSQDFTLGKPDGFQGWEYYSTNEGRIQVVNGQLRMDDMVNGSAYSLNEAILHLDLRGRSEVILTLDHFSSVDENDSLPSSFMGHSNGDGILISADGTNWYLLTNLTSDFQQQSFDLDAAIQSAGISYSSDFRIKFQQYDDSSWPEDGRAFDNISITTKGPVPPLPSEGPFGTWMGTFNSTSYGTSGTISNWIMREDYTTEGKWELHVGANTGFRIHPSGTYSFSPANNHLDFLYTGLATVWVEGQITDVPCILDVNGTVFQDNASGSYMLKLFPSNLLPFSDTGTWQATRIPNVVYHVFGIEICTGWNYNDPNLRNDSTYDFCLALETDNTISHVDFLTPAGYTFQIPGYTHMQSDNIQTWHYELEATPSETPSTVGLVAHWKMDDNAATTSVVDSSGKGNHGTAQWNTSTLSTPGKINGALTFDGKSDYIDCGNNSSLDLTNNFTIAAWVKPYSFSWLTGIVGKYHSPNANSYYLRLDLNPPYNKFQFGGKSWVTSLSTLNANQWYFVVGMRDSGIGKIYLNGNLDASSAVLISSSSDPVYIGMDYQPDARYFYGVIDDVMIFNRTLSEAEIKALHVQPIGSKEYWRYEGKFTRSDALTDYGDGIYTITVHYKDGSQYQTTAWFGIPNTSDVIPQPTQKPVLTFPKHNGRTTSPVTFTWETCKGTNATSTALCLEKQDSTGEYIDIVAPVDSTGSDPIELSPGIWNAKLFCNRWYDYSNPDGIALEVGKYSETDYSFEVLGGGLVAHWKMDDNTATTTVLDSSGRGNHGIAQRNTSTLSTPGKINGALTFDGKSDYIDCGNNNSLYLTDNFAIAAWIKPRHFSWLAGIVGKYHSPNANSYYLRLNHDAPYHKLEFGGLNWVTSLSTLNTDQWYFVVGMRDSGIGKIYINGKLDNSSAVSILSSADPLYIGMDYQPAARYFDGEIDNVMIFNRVLSEAELAALYNGGAGIEIF